MSGQRNASEIHSPTAWERDLTAAGWTKKRHTVWTDPEGNLWRGPYGAWCELQLREASRKANHSEPNRQGNRR